MLVGLLNFNKKSKHKKLKLLISAFALTVIIGLFLFFHMGYNVKYDLKSQVNSYLSSRTVSNLRTLKRVSINKKTYFFLKSSMGSKVRDLSDFEGNFGKANDEYFVCSIDGKKAGIIMTKENGYWKVASIQIYK